MRHGGDGPESTSADGLPRREGRWAALGKNLAFQAERFLTRGTYSKVAALWVVLLLLSLVGGLLAWLAPDIEFDGLRQAVWWAFLRISDPGYLVEAESPGVRLLSIALTVLGLALFVGVLIAIITEGFTRFMERLALGLTPVRFSGHVAVLGWTNRTLGLVTELLGDRRDPPHVVVLVRCITADMEQALQDRLPRRLRGRVVLRTGDPERLEDLARIRGDAARAVVLPGGDEPDPTVDPGDSRVLKVIASVDRTTGGADARPLVVAEMRNANLIPIAHGAYSGPLQMIASDVIVGRSLALGVLSPGLSLALADIVDVRSGRTLRVDRYPELAGETIARASSRLPTAVIAGAARDRAGDRRLLSAPDSRLEEDDLLVVLAPAGPGSKPLAAPVDPGRPLEYRARPETESTLRVLILGWSGKVRELCGRLADQSEQRVLIDVVSRRDAAERESALAGGPPTTSVRHIGGDAASPATLAGLDLSGYDRIALMGSESAGGRFQADSRTIATALLLLNRLEGTAARPHLIAEILDPANRAVLEGRGIELVVTADLVARVLAGAITHPELADVFEGMVEGRLGQLGVIPLDELGATGETTFGAIESCLRPHGIICLGLQREARAFVPELAPDKRDVLRIGPSDRAFIVKPRAEEGAGTAFPMR